MTANLKNLRLQLLLPARFDVHPRMLCIALLAVVVIVAPGAVPAFAEVTDADMLNLSAAVPEKQLPSAEEVSIGGLIARMALSLGVVFGLIWLVSWGAKKYLPNQVNAVRGGAIKILSTRSIGARKSLMLVRVQDKTILIGVTPSGMNMLTEVEESGEAWRDVSARTGLDEMMSGAGPAAREGVAG